MGADDLGVWFPTVRATSGADVFTERLAAGLAKLGVRTEITWLPLRAEYAPWSIPMPQPPPWATIAHINTTLPPRLVPSLPAVATLHHAIHEPELEGVKGPLRALYHQHWIRRIERATMRLSARVVAVSHFAANSARRHLLDHPMVVIHNGVDVERFAPAPRKSPSEPFRLLYIGRWTRTKGVDLLAPIMQELGAGFLLSYTGSEADWAVSLPNMRNIGRLEGADAVIAAMHEADAFLFPSRSEGFGLAAVEALACGLPVVATKGSSLSELIEDGETGILASEVCGFASAIKRLAGDPVLWLKMSAAARQRAVKHYSLDKMVNAYMNLYGTLSRKAENRMVYS